MPIVMYKDSPQTVSANHTFTGTLTMTGTVDFGAANVTGLHSRQQWNFHVSSLPNGATSYIHFNWSESITPVSSESLANGGLTLFIKPGTFDAFQVTAAVAPGAGKSWTFTVRNVSTGDSSLVATIANNSTTSGIVTGAVRFLQGEFWDVKIVPAGTPTNPTHLYFALSGTFDA
jgi:hypothetical protein